MGDEQLHRDRLDAAVAALRAGEADWPDGLAAWFGESLRAFEDMLDRGRFPLTEKQAGWLEKVAAALELDLPEAPRAPVPRGKPVALLVDSMPRPRRPPVRRA